jgi:hypothetical protein
MKSPTGIAAGLPLHLERWLVKAGARIGVRTPAEVMVLNRLKGALCALRLADTIHTS